MGPRTTMSYLILQIIFLYYYMFYLWK